MAAINAVVRFGDLFGGRTQAGLERAKTQGSALAAVARAYKVPKHSIIGITDAFKDGAELEKAP